MEVHVRNALEEVRVQTPGDQFFSEGIVSAWLVPKGPSKKSLACRTRKPHTDVEVAKLKAAVKKLNAVSYDKVTLRMGNSQAFVQNPYYVYNITNGMNTWGPILAMMPLILQTLRRCMSIAISLMFV